MWPWGGKLLHTRSVGFAVLGAGQSVVVDGSLALLASSSARSGHRKAPATIA